MPQFKSITTAFAVSWLFSALIHVVDSDVGGIQGLWSPLVLISVSVIATVVLLPALFCFAAFQRYRWGGFVVSLFVMATTFGGLLAFLGAGGTPAQSRFIGFLGSTAIFALFLFLASVPLILVPALRNNRQIARK